MTEISTEEQLRLRDEQMRDVQAHVCKALSVLTKAERHLSRSSPESATLVRSAKVHLVEANVDLTKHLFVPSTAPEKRRAGLEVV